MQYDLSSLQSWLYTQYPERGLLVVPYAYTLSFLALTNAAPATQVLNVNATADFVLSRVSYHANIAAAVQTVSTKPAALVRMLITDTGSNEQYTSAPVDLENYATNSAWENCLPYPRIVSGRSALNITLTNYDAAATYNLDLLFTGVLVRAYTQQERPDLFAQRFN